MYPSSREYAAYPSSNDDDAAGLLEAASAELGKLREYGLEADGGRYLLQALYDIHASVSDLLKRVENLETRSPAGQGRRPPQRRK